jgi:hypothetical protein
MDSRANKKRKVRLTIECTIAERERAYIKKRKMISGSNEPNAETIEALIESREGALESYKTLNEFWKALGIDPNIPF